MAKDWMDDLSEQQVRVAHMVADEAERQGIPVPLALAAAMQESSFQQLKKSGTGPQGVMMVGKAASKDLGIDPKKVNENIRGGITYLKQQLDKNNWDYDKALVAYHDGPNSPYVLGTGPMSPAAENHIAKVKEYGGYEGYEAPAAAAAQEVVDTSVAPVEQIDYVEPAAGTGESSGADLLAAGIGAGAGALKSPHKPQSLHSIDQQLKEHAANVQPIKAANKALEDQYKADVRAREDAIALRKAAQDTAAKTAGSDVRNYTLGQFGGNIPETINPLDMGESQSMGKQAVKAQRRVEQMMPGVQFDPTRGLLLPPGVQTIPKAPPVPIDAGLPPVRQPKLQPIPQPQIYKGSMLGRAGTSVGGAAALGLGANAVDRAMSGDDVGAVLGGLAAAGGAGTQARNPRTAVISGAAGLGALGTQMLYDKFKPKEKSVLEGFSKGGLASLPHYAGAKESFVKKMATVMRPQRVAYPEIYQDPRMLVGEAASRVAPEDPLLKRLFNVDREDLWNISQQGTRKGNITERPFNAAANAKGAAHAGEVMNPRNTQRLQDIIGEAQQRPELYKGMASWYTMDPLYKRFVDLYGPEQAVEAYKKFNTLTGMASPGSEVMTELNRGTAANYLSNQGRFEDFKKFGGQAGRGPADMAAVMGHPYHSTAQSGPMEKYLSSGLLDMGSAKVPSYIHASGVPETGFQTSWPVGDAHWSRLVGLPDVRGARTVKGKEAVPNASASVPEMTALGPWWKDKVAQPMGLEAVPAQAVVWGAGSGATGVTSPIGAGKLELLARQIGNAAERMGVTPETARDMIIQGKAYAGGLPTK